MLLLDIMFPINSRNFNGYPRITIYFALHRFTSRRGSLKNLYHQYNTSWCYDKLKLIKKIKFTN